MAVICTLLWASGLHICVTYRLFVKLSFHQISCIFLDAEGPSCVADVVECVMKATVFV